MSLASWDCIVTIIVCIRYPGYFCICFWVCMHGWTMSRLNHSRVIVKSSTYSMLNVCYFAGRCCQFACSKWCRLIVMKPLSCWTLVLLRIPQAYLEHSRYFKSIIINNSKSTCILLRPANIVKEITCILGAELLSRC